MLPSGAISSMARNLWTRTAEVDLRAVALDRETGPHHHVARLEAVVVGVIGAFVDPVGQGRDGHAHPAFGVVEDAVEQRQRMSDRHLPREFGDALRPDAGCAEHRAKVSVLQLRGA